MFLIKVNSPGEYANNRKSMDSMQSSIIEGRKSMDSQDSKISTAPEKYYRVPPGLECDTPSYNKGITQITKFCGWS